MAGGLGCPAHPLIRGLVIGVVAVAEIEPCDVHAGLDQGPDHIVGTGSRTEGADDLAAARHGPSIVASRYIQVAWMLKLAQMFDK